MVLEACIFKSINYKYYYEISLGIAVKILI